MARQGRFGRSTSGSQNLSSLIYSLLREERNDQEDTMIRSYRNNMRGGVSTNTFSSGGTTSSATSNSVYQWYLDQANLARQSGDNLGYNSLMQRAEEFRIASLGDQETLLSNAFQSGTSIDFSLFGGVGSGTLTLQQFEALMTGLANNPSLTETDRSRIGLTLFTTSLTSTAGDLARGYDEGTKTANDLVAFYDKELERARNSGITTDSQLYQNMLNARSRYIKAGQVDASNARVKAVESGIKDEMLAVAKGLQTFLMPIIEKRFRSKETIAALKATISGDGFEFIKRLNTALGESGNTMYQLIYDAAVAGNYSQDQIDSILQSASEFSAEAKRLAGLYPAEADAISTFAGQLSEAAAYGGFQALGRGASQDFQSAISSSGGTVGVAGTSDPYATVTALKEYAAKIGVISENPSYDQMQIADIAFQYASGNLGIGSGDGSAKAVIDEIASLYSNYNKQNISLALAELLSGNENAWKSKDPLYRSVARWIQGNGLEANDLLSPIDPTIGGITLGQVMQYSVESEMTRMVDEDPNLVYTYRFVPELNSVRFVAESVATVKSDPTYMAYTTTGKGSEIVYIKRINIKVDGAGDSNIFLIPVPGGEGSFGTGATGDMDTNDYLEFRVGPSTVRLTVQDINDIETYSGVPISLPRIAQDGTGSILLDQATVNFLTSTGSSSPLTAWMFEEAKTRGEDWLATKFVANKDVLGQNSSLDSVVNSFVDRITPAAKAAGENVNLDELIRATFAQDGINDKTGKLYDLVASKLDAITYTTDDRQLYFDRIGPLTAGIYARRGVPAPWELPSNLSYPTQLVGQSDWKIRNYLGLDSSEPIPQAAGSLTPNVIGYGFDPNALPGYANPGQLSTTGLNIPEIEAPPMGRDYFFRKINPPNAGSGPTRPSRFQF